MASIAYGKFLLLATAINVWQSFHYLRQVYGVGRFVSRDSGETDKERKLTFWAYHLAVPLFVLGRWDTIFIAWHGKPTDYIWPVDVPDPVMNVCWVLAGIGLSTGLFSEAMRFKRKGASSFSIVPLMNLLVYYILHYFGFLSVEYFQRGFFAVTAFHAIQYMAISWVLEDKKKSEETVTGQLLLSVPNVVKRYSFVVFYLMLLLLAYLLDNVATRINVFWLQGSAVLLLALSAHHYTVDTRIWRKAAGV